MSKSLISGSDSEKIAKLTNFKTKIAVIGPALGYSAAKITAVQTKCQVWIDALQAKATLFAEYRSKVSALKARNKSGPGSLRAEFKLIKANDAYTEQIGEELMILEDSVNIETDTMKVEVKCEAINGVARIKFKKLGTQGVNVYSRLKGEADWVFIGTAGKSPFYDNRPLKNSGTPEAREYTAYPVLDLKQVGVASDIVSAIVG